MVFDPAGDPRAVWDWYLVMRSLRPAPTLQAKFVRFWPRAFGHTKSGLVGGHLPVANVGAYTAGDAGGGFELVAFGPVPPNEPGGVAPPVAPPAPPSP